MPKSVTCRVGLFVFGIQSWAIKSLQRIIFMSRDSQRVVFDLLLVEQYQKRTICSVLLHQKQSDQTKPVKNETLKYKYRCTDPKS